MNESQGVQSTNTCANCGSPMEDGAMFCVNCGAKKEIPPTTTYQTCHRCGNSIQGDFVTCPYCGDSLVANTGSTQYNGAYSNSNPEAEAKRKKRNRLLIIIGIVVLVIILVLSYVVISKVVSSVGERIAASEDSSKGNSSKDNSLDEKFPDTEISAEVQSMVGEWGISTFIINGEDVLKELNDIVAIAGEEMELGDIIYAEFYDDKTFIINSGDDFFAGTFEFRDGDLYMMTDGEETLADFDGYTFTITEIDEGDEILMSFTRR